MLGGGWGLAVVYLHKINDENIMQVDNDDIKYIIKRNQRTKYIK